MQESVHSVTEVVSLYIPEVTEKNYENIIQDGQYPNRYSIRVPPEC
jgi:hypothetical protein